MRPITTFDADLAAMREAREQMRELRVELEDQEEQPDQKEQETLLRAVVADLKRRAFGDAEHARELDEEFKADWQARRAAGPAPGVRRKLKPRWAWWKRLRGR